MSATDFSTTITTDHSPTEVFNAVNNVRGWWHGSVEGYTTHLNDEFTYRFEDVHYSKQKIVELIPGEKIVWLVTDSKLTFIKKEDEWTGTKIIFEISPVNGKTQLRLTHEGLQPAVECYGACSNGWTKLIRESLLSLITTGEGKEVF